MKTKEELQKGCAEMLKRIRQEKGLSKAKMADMVYVDEHTWSRYESGKSAPSVPDFLWMFNMMGEDALKIVLDFIYPEIYENLNSESDIRRLREAASHYFLKVASDQMVREWDYMIFGEHGSNIEPQINEFTMINHLPMEYRYAIANMVYTLYQLAEYRGELIGTDHVMPNKEVFLDGLKKGTHAAMNKRQSYTTSME